MALCPSILGVGFVVRPWPIGDQFARARQFLVQVCASAYRKRAG
jgi:hypothetical protein